MSRTCIALIYVRRHIEHHISNTDNFELGLVPHVERHPLNISVSIELTSVDTHVGSRAYVDIPTKSVLDMIDFFSDHDWYITFVIFDQVFL